MMCDGAGNKNDVLCEDSNLDGDHNPDIGHMKERKDFEER